MYSQSPLLENLILLVWDTIKDSIEKQVREPSAGLCLPQEVAIS